MSVFNGSLESLPLSETPQWYDIPEGVMVREFFLHVLLQCSEQNSQRQALIMFQLDQPVDALTLTGSGLMLSETVGPFVYLNTGPGSRLSEIAVRVPQGRRIMRMGVRAWHATGQMTLASLWVEKESRAPQPAQAKPVSVGEKRIDACIKDLGAILAQNGVPSIGELHAAGRAALAAGDTARSRQCELLIPMLHNSSVPLGVTLGEKVDFAYGGIGTIVHKDAIIGSWVTLGSGVTIGGTPHPRMVKGERRAVPVIEDHVYIGTGAKIAGGVLVGKYSIVGMNAVVVRDVEPYSVVGGVPARKIVDITPENYKKYVSYFHKGIPWDQSFAKMFPSSTPA